MNQADSPLETVSSKLNTSSAGLSGAEATRHRRDYGPLEATKFRYHEPSTDFHWGWGT